MKLINKLNLKISELLEVEKVNTYNKRIYFVKKPKMD